MFAVNNANSSFHTQQDVLSTEKNTQVNPLTESLWPKGTLQPLELPKHSNCTVMPLDLQQLAPYSPLTILKDAPPVFSEKDLLSTKCEDQRVLLQYASKKDRQAIVKAQKSVWMPYICDNIKKGKWQELLNAHTSDVDIGYILLAAYCAKKIGIADLATAMMMVRTFRNAPQGAVKIVKVSSVHLAMFQTKGLLDVHEKNDNKKKEATISRIKEVPQNQRYITLVKLDAFDRITKFLIDSIFKDTHEGLGFRKYKLADGCIYLGVGSFGLLNRFCTEVATQRGIKCRPRPILHLVPSRRDMALHLLAGIEPVAVLLPNERPRIHGSTDRLTFATVHDYYHVFVRACRLEWAPYAQRFALIIEDKALLDYKGKSREVLTEEELVIMKTLYELCDRLVDGAFMLQHTKPWLGTVEPLIEEVIIGLNVPFDTTSLKNIVVKQLEPVFSALRNGDPYLFWSALPG